MEVWKDVVGYEGIYQVSNLGNVKSLSNLKISNNKHGSYSFYTKEIILKKAIDNGYEKVVLTKNNIRSTQKVHRLVCIAFLGYKENLVVNHIDFNPSNNNINNLEWTTIQGNNNHSRINNRYPKLIMSENHKQILKERTSKKVICTKTLFIYDSIRDASKSLNIKESTLRHYLIGSRKNKTSLKLL
jgi:hypothetical protein